MSDATIDIEQWERIVVMTDAIIEKGEERYMPGMALTLKRPDQLRGFTITTTFAQRADLLDDALDPMYRPPLHVVKDQS